MECKDAFLVIGPEGKSILFMVRDGKEMKGVLVFPHQNGCHAKQVDPKAFVEMVRLSDVPSEAFNAAKALVSTMKLFESLTDELCRQTLVIA